MAGHETGKQRAVRVPLDYFKRPDGLQRWKLRLTVIALLATVAIAAGSLLRKDQGLALASRGPLAAVHATWDSDCAACHVRFEPMGGHIGVSKVVGGTHASDKLCQNCHLGPAHSSRQIDAEVGSCADCHRDHRGRDVSLRRLPDSDCTRCHASLEGHVKPDARPALFGNVSAFADGQHPPFKLPADPGRLKFNHQLHLTAGMWRKTTEGDKAFFTLADIKDETERERYRVQQPENQRLDKDGVQLDCAACHRLDSRDFGLKPGQFGNLPASLLLPPRASGAIFQPIVYENQCKACHPLTAAASLPADKAPRLIAVPHGQQPAEINQFLRRTLLADLINDQPLLDDSFTPPRLKPGDPDEMTGKKTTLRHVLDRQVTTAEKLLYSNKQTCQECHDYRGTFAFKSDGPTFTIEPTNVPDIWMKHARFTHATHGALRCVECHAKAETSTESKDVLLPGIDNCLQCHGPAQRVNGVLKGGARFDCTECHGYHNGDKPLQGRGAAVLFPKRQNLLTIPEFLSGGKARP